MAFRIRSPKLHKVFKRKKSAAELDILKRLEDYLDSSVQEPVEFLAQFWEDQSNVITYKALREAILVGEISVEMLELWQQDYSNLVANKLRPLWENSIVAGVTNNPFDLSDFSLNFEHERVLGWIDNHSAEFITNLMEEQKKAIRVLLSESEKGIYTVDELSKTIRPCIGLTEPQSKANLKYYNHIKEELRKAHPKMKTESIRKKARDAAAKYAEKQHRQRAYNIAQAELAFAYNHGYDESVRQAQENGLLGKMKKRWIDSGDGNVCSTCRALDGTEIEMDEEFEFKGKVVYEGQKKTPPAHNHCACALQYVEVEAPVFSNEEVIV